MHIVRQFVRPVDNLYISRICHVQPNLTSQFFLLLLVHPIHDGTLGVMDVLEEKMGFQQFEVSVQNGGTEIIDRYQNNFLIRMLAFVQKNVK